VSLAKVVAKSLVWTSLESFAGSGLSLLCLVIFARLLSSEEFGVVAVALAIVQVLTIPVELTFQDALIQRKELSREHIDSAFTVSALLGIVLCAACWLLADSVERLIGAPPLGNVLRWMSLSLVGSGFGGVLVAVQRRNLEFRVLALRSLIGRAASALIALALAFWGAGMWSLVVQQVLLYCLGSLVLWTLSSERPSLGFAWIPARELLRFGVFSTLYQLLYALTSRVFMVLVGAYLGSQSAGLLSMAFRGLDMLRDLMTQAVSQIAMPLFSRMREDGAVLFEAFARAVQLTTLIAYPLFVGLAVCSEEVLTIAFGAKWVLAAPYFTVIALLALEKFARMYGQTVVQALGRPSLINLEVAAQAVFILVGMVTVGRLSTTHALGVWAARLLVSVPVEMTVLRHVTGMSYLRQLRGARVPSLAAALMGLLVWLAKQQLHGVPPALRMVPLALVGLLSYGSAVWLLDRQTVLQLRELVVQTLRRKRA
jgi:O-antigen/teichoic acid export membrane protein